MLRTNEIVALEKYKRKGKEENDEESCDVEMQYAMDEIEKSLSCKELRHELKQHGLKISGRKVDLQQRLTEHNESHDL